VKRLAFAGVLVLSMLWSNIAANAETPPPLSGPAASFAAGSVHVDVYGTPGKPALLFIPGLTCGAWEWSGEIARFSPSYRIYALTLPGFDGVPTIKTPLFDTVSSDVWAMMQQQHIDRPTIVGHSLGGTLAILLAEQHPDRLRKVIAVDGLPVFPGTQLMTASQRAAMAQRSSQFPASQKSALQYMVTAPADVDAIAAATAKADPAATGRWVYEDLMLDLRANLKNVTIPIVEIAPFDPSLDPYGPARIADAAGKQRYYASLFEGAPRTTVKVISPSRHFVMYDQPAALHTALEAALR
jgi:pimeloyl-ACP methyl ester carboxylesterase